MSEQPKTKETNESEVWNVIDAFEQIIEADPNDRVALETLFEAYEQIGQNAKALEHLVNLGQTIFEENDASSAPSLLKHLQRLAGEETAALELIERLEPLANTSAEPPPSTPIDSNDSEKHKARDITSELSLAWNLVQSGELNQDEYSMIAQALSEQSTHDGSHTTVSVLHAIHARGFGDLENIISHISRDTGTPIMALSSFEVQTQAHSLIPLDASVERGALVFELMGQEALVAILNPYDNDLRDYVQNKTKRTCHFYLVTPNDFDATIEELSGANSLAQAS